MLKLRARCVEKKVFSRVSFIMKFFNVACAAVFVKFTRKRSLITFLYAYPFYMIGTSLENMEENKVLIKLLAALALCSCSLSSLLPLIT